MDRAGRGVDWLDGPPPRRGNPTISTSSSNSQAENSTAAAPMAASRRRTSWRRFSLRAFVVIVTLLAVAFAFVGDRRRQVIRLTGIALTVISPAHSSPRRSVRSLEPVASPRPSRCLGDSFADRFLRRFLNFSRSSAPRESLVRGAKACPKPPLSTCH